MIFDDYQWIDPNHPGQETHRGIDAFLEIAQHHLAMVYQGYQVIVRKLKIPAKQVVKPQKTLYPSSSNSRPQIVARS